MKGYRKYRNKPVTLDGLRFDSKKEAARYSELKILESCGTIKDLRLQVKFSICPKGPGVKGGRERCDIADGVYTTMDGDKVIEDTKSDATRKDKTYRLKKQLVQVKYPEYIFLET